MLTEENTKMINFISCVIDYLQNSKVGLVLWCKRNKSIQFNSENDVSDDNELLKLTRKLNNSSDLSYKDFCRMKLLNSKPDNIQKDNYFKENSYKLFELENDFVTIIKDNNFIFLADNLENPDLNASKNKVTEIIENFSDSEESFKTELV